MPVFPLNTVLNIVPFQSVLKREYFPALNTACIQAGIGQAIFGSQKMPKKQNIETREKQKGKTPTN